MKFLKIIGLILSLFVVQSCYEKLDFDQLDDVVYRPVLTSSLTNFTLLPAQFFNSQGVQQNSVSDTTIFDLLQDDLIQNDVFRIDFYVEMKNEFDRDLTIYVQFLDENNTVVYNFSPIQASSNTTNTTYLEEIIIDQNPAILNTVRVLITVELENTGTQMNPNSTDEFELKSSITAYIESEI